MREQQYFWVFDRTIWDQIRFPAFELWETLTLAAVFLGLSAYLGLIVFLDRRILAKARYVKQVTLLRPRLEAAGLGEREMSALARLAGSARESRLFKFLGDPATFERRIHEEMESGHGEELGFTVELRNQLGYHAENFLVPMVSSRQFRVGDAIRVSAKGTGLGSHHYGVVDSVVDWGFTVLLGESGLETRHGPAPELEIFYVRGQDLEYRFPCVPSGPVRGGRRLSFRHVLADPGWRPRQTRLPLLLEVQFRERPLHRQAADELDPDLAPSPKEKGILHDLNDGGFALVSSRSVEPGCYLEFYLPTKRGKRPMSLMGRVTTCREIPGGYWMVHATLRGMDRAKRHLLHQIVMHEQTRRFKSLAHIQPRRASTAPSAPRPIPPPAPPVSETSADAESKSHPG